MTCFADESNATRRCRNDLVRYSGESNRLRRVTASPFIAAVQQSGFHHLQLEQSVQGASSILFPHMSHPPQTSSGSFIPSFMTAVQMTAKATGQATGPTPVWEVMIAQATTPSSEHETVLITRPTISLHAAHPQPRPIACTDCADIFETPLSSTPDAAQSSSADQFPNAH